jgi:hypothetical protein
LPTSIGSGVQNANFFGSLLGSRGVFQRCAPVLRSSATRNGSATPSQLMISRSPTSAGELPQPCTGLYRSSCFHTTFPSLDRQAVPLEPKWT